MVVKKRKAWYNDKTLAALAKEHGTNGKLGGVHLMGSSMTRSATLKRRSN